VSQLCHSKTENVFRIACEQQVLLYQHSTITEIHRTIRHWKKQNTAQNWPKSNNDMGQNVTIRIYRKSMICLQFRHN